MFRKDKFKQPGMYIFSIRNLACVISVILSNVCFPQREHLIDSLKKKLNSVKTDADKAPLMLDIAIEYADANDSAQTLLYSNAALGLYKQLRDVYGIAKTKKRQAKFYTEIGQWPLSEKMTKEALNLLKNDTTKKGKLLYAKILYDYSLLSERMGIKKKSVELLFESSVIFEKYQEYKGLSNTYRNIGVFYAQNQDPGRAGHYYKKSLDAAIQTKDTGLIFETLMLNAYNWMVTRDFHKMNTYLEEAKNNYTLPKKSSLWWDYFYLKAHYYIDRKEYSKALDCLNQGQLVIDKSDKMNILNSMGARVRIYDKQKNYTKALESAAEMYKIVSNDTIFFHISTRAELLMDLVSLEEEIGNFKQAYYHLQEKLALDRRVNTQEMPLKLKELEVKYESIKKDKDLLKLQNNNRLQEIKLQRNRTLNIGLFSGIFILVLAITLGYIIFYNKRRLTEKKEIIYLQQIENLKKEQELISYDAILEGQEKERTRLAGDLHDGLNGILSGIVMQLSAMDKRENQTDQALSLKHIIGRMNEAVTEVRNISHNLMPANLVKLGLDNNLKDLCNNLKSEQTNIIYRSYDLSKTILPREQITIYRMIQELVVNAVKHSGAKTILVECLQNGKQLDITVEDDGKGFDEWLIKDKKGIGIDNVKNRVDFLKGTINIRSLIDIGTTIHIQCTIND